MERYFLFDENNTYTDWHLILTEKNADPPEPKTNYIELDGMSGSIDLTEALTGDVHYSDRKITASFWTDEGNVQDRYNLVNGIVRAIHGRKVTIVDPDDNDHYMLGRITISDVEHNKTYSVFNLSAVCEPWRYGFDTLYNRVSVAGINDLVLTNRGSKVIIPRISVTGNLTITFGGVSTTLTTGEYRILSLRMLSGDNIIRLTGNAEVTFIYEEASL